MPPPPNRAAGTGPASGSSQPPPRTWRPPLSAPKAAPQRRAVRCGWLRGDAVLLQRFRPRAKVPGRWGGGIGRNNAERPQKGWWKNALRKFILRLCWYYSPRGRRAALGLHVARRTALTVARSPTEGPSASTNIRHLVQELEAKLGSDAILHSIKEKSSQDSNLQESTAETRQKA